eukprot:NODE_120_length_18891_cov_0.302682.p4 type:complete len:614 gc:universal NODE_120_length_18891_cov_0.302682:14689-12848(-)
MNYIYDTFSSLVVSSPNKVIGTLYLKADQLQTKYKECELEVQKHSEQYQQMVITKIYENNEADEEYDEYIVLLSPEINLEPTSGGFKWLDDNLEMIFMTKNSAKILQTIMAAIPCAKPLLEISQDSVIPADVQGISIYSAKVVLFSFNVKDSLFDPVSDKQIKFEIIQNLDKFYLKCSGEFSCICLVSHSMNPYFSQEKWCFLWNQYDQVLVSLAAVFDTKDYALFRSQLQRILINQQKLKLNFDELAYAQSAAVQEDVEMEEAPLLESEDSDESDEEKLIESNDKKPNDSSKKGRLSKLATAMSSYRAFVIRGNSIDVYSSFNKIKHQTTLNMDRQPDHLQLHDSESKIITSNADNVSLMDIERNKVVQSWEAPKELKSLSTYNKAAQTTSEQQFYGITKDKVMLMDPRTRNLIANSISYKSKIDFTCISTNNSNQIAVGNAQGELKLYDKLDSKARTNFKLGEPLLAIDIHEDGHYVICTCSSHLLLVQVNDFNKTIPIKERSKPIRLSLRPDHVGLLGLKYVNFTAAKFYGNYIMTSTGNYIFAWDLKAAKLGKNKYTMQGYDSTVIGEQLNNNKVVVALQDELVLASKKEFKQPQKMFVVNSYNKTGYK